MGNLLRPPPPLAPHARPYLFWIWLQLIVLRLYVRRTRGPGVPFLFGYDNRGRVWMIAIGDGSAARQPDSWMAPTNSTYLRALQPDEGDNGHPSAIAASCGLAASSIKYIVNCNDSCSGADRQQLPPPDI